MNIQEAMKAAYQERQAGNPAAAEALCRRILAEQPNHAHALNLLGLLFHQARRHDVASGLFGRALSIAPANPEFYFNLGLSLTAEGLLDQAAAAYQRSVDLEPSSVAALCNLATALQQTGKIQAAIVRYRQAIAIQPDYADAHNNLGSALRASDDLDGAIVSFRRAIALQPRNAATLNNLAGALYANGDVEGAVSACRQGLALRGDFPQGHWTMALLLLVQGDFERGWPEYEWRLKLPTARRTEYARPLWDGSDLSGKRLLLHTEQGFGDTIQFVRFIPQILQRGGTVVLACQPELRTLLAGVAGMEKVVDMGAPLPEFDCHCPLPSLPNVLRTTPAGIPAEAPYLRPAAAATAKWRERLSHDNRLNVGLAWAGRPNPDPKRAMPLATLAPLAQIPGARFFSLQKGAAGLQARGAAMDLTDWTGELSSFADTAALIANLDLVISIDTAVAHLAGAMGQRTWTLLPFAPDWRWLLAGEDCPWYPTMRLFRQPKINDWDTVVGRIAEALGDLVRCGPASL